MRSVCRLYLLLFLLIFAPACQYKKTRPVVTSSAMAPDTMQVEIIRKILFPAIPSASGLEIIRDQVYVVGDDSPFLYVLDLKSFKLTHTIPLFASADFSTGRIPKALKPDLECLTTIELAGEKYLLALGSGSAPNRDKGFLIKLPAQTGGTATVQAYSLEPLYRALRQKEELLNGDLLNLEAAAVTAQGDLWLWQRAAVTGPNVVLRFKAAEFIHSLTSTTSPLPAFTLTPFNLPDIAGISARFSGAYAYEDLVFFTASVENTPDAILDGEVLGSFVGCIPAQNAGDAISIPITALIRESAGAVYKGKVESIAIYGKVNQNTYRGLAITDNDNGESELLELLITL